MHYVKIDSGVRRHLVNLYNITMINLDECDCNWDKNKDPDIRWVMSFLSAHGRGEIVFESEKEALVAFDLIDQALSPECP